MSKYIALDPGGTTGVCVYSAQNTHSGNFLSSELGRDRHHADLWNLLTKANPDLVIIERFDYRPRLQKVDLTAIEYIGIAQLYCDLTGKELIQQSVMKGDRGLWTDDKLKVLGLYKPGNPHANDALRHMLYFITVAEGNKYYVRRVRSGEPLFPPDDSSAESA